MKIDAKLVLSIIALVISVAVLTTILVRNHDANLAAQQSLAIKLFKLDKQVTLCNQQLDQGSPITFECKNMIEQAQETFGDDILVWFGVNYKFGFINDNNMEQVSQSIVKYDESRVRFILSKTKEGR